MVDHVRGVRRPGCSCWVVLRALLTTVVCLAIILGTGLWHDTMATLAMTLVATIAVMLLGFVFGVWIGRSRKASIR